MTLNEFKAWLDGYGAAIQGEPTADQWAVIQGKLAELKLKTITHIPFVKYDDARFGKITYT